MTSLHLHGHYESMLKHAHTYLLWLLLLLSCAPTPLSQAWLSKGFGWGRTNNFVWAQHGKFHDQLVSDLGTASHHKSNTFAELFGYVKNEVSRKKNNQKTGCSKREKLEVMFCVVQGVN